MKLIIFDMDQTLVDFVAVHDGAAKMLFRNEFGVEARLTEVDCAGKALLQSFAEIAKMKGIPAERITDHGPELLTSYEKYFGELIREVKGDPILPGVIPLLEELSKTDNLVALYTGDSQGIVKHVFDATGLGKFFRFAVCANEAKTRAGMVELAVARAEKLTGKGFKGKDIVIIGDSVRDIEAGKAMGAFTISVATGSHSEADLAEHKPDRLFRDLSDYRKVLRAIG
jgi:phosphoglycolate phosphatase